MKNFAKKLVSAAMALTLAASMSVYAEEIEPIENVYGNAQGIFTEYSVNGLPCNHVTFRGDEYPTTPDWVFHGTHTVNGQTCTISKKMYQYDLTCMKCMEVVGHVVTRTEYSHSMNHG